MISQHDSEVEIQRISNSLSGLCRIGGIAALILAAYSLATIVQMVMLGGQPSSAAQAFDLLEHHRVIGLLRLDLPTIAAVPLYYFVFPGLFAALRRSDRSNALLAIALAFVGTTLTLATPTALSMIPLQRQICSGNQRYCTKPVAGCWRSFAGCRHLAFH